MTSSHLSLISENIVSNYQAGAFFGALFAYPVGFYWGRNIGLWIAGLIFVLGAGMMMCANGERGLSLIYAGRVLAGLAVGIYELGWQIGGLDGDENTLSSGKEQWMITFAVQMIPGGLYLIGLLFVRESPRWLLSRSRREEGIKMLCWMRQLEEHDIYILEEIRTSDQTLEE
ncbi:hypothetical protein N7490_003895 [Penicillium lividum]|nr:hypothetical protein N7490_003895 [Penicillium lividum]